MKSTNIKLLLEFSHPAIDLKIFDRHGKILIDQTNNQSISLINFCISMPNQLTIAIDNVLSGYIVKVLEMKIGPIKLSNSILSQIFSFYDQQDNQVTTYVWRSNGKAVVDLFSEDWIQYHLLYRNKIQTDQ